MRDVLVKVLLSFSILAIVGAFFPFLLVLKVAEACFVAWRLIVDSMRNAWSDQDA